HPRVVQAVAKRTLTQHAPIHPLRKSFLRRMMDPRVEPAGDGEKLRSILFVMPGLDPGIHRKEALQFEGGGLVPRLNPGRSSPAMTTDGWVPLAPLQQGAGSLIEAWCKVLSGRRSSSTAEQSLRKR